MLKNKPKKYWTKNKHIKMLLFYHLKRLKNLALNQQV